MAEKKLLTDGLGKLVNITIDHKNLAQSYTLFDFLLTEGGKIKRNSKLLKLAVNTESPGNTRQMKTFKQAEG